jgi:hypothetical protein
MNLDSFLVIYWKYSQNKDRLHGQNNIIYQQRSKGKRFIGADSILN